jgi:2-isopropylmalate synthase
MTPRDSQPFVGRDAFTHKGGMHADAVRKLKASYEHIDPTTVGNRTHIAVSEVSGRSSVIQKAEEFNIALDRDSADTKAILERIKELENEGYEFEGADASLELILRKGTGLYRSFFKTKGFHTHVSYHSDNGDTISEATVKLEIENGPERHTVAEGHGPVDAMNNALRKALEEHFPELSEIRLDDYKVRILDGKLATRAKTRVLIESSDKERSWYTIGVSDNILVASFIALRDSIKYKLLQTRGHAG